jgi:hypothetical protein
MFRPRPGVVNGRAADAGRHFYPAVATVSGSPPVVDLVRLLL